LHVLVLETPTGSYRRFDGLIFIMKAGFTSRGSMEF